MSNAVALAISAAKLVVRELSPAILAAVSAFKLVVKFASAASTYVLIAFTDGYFVFEAPSVTTFVDLFTKSSFNKSALALITASLANPAPPALIPAST